MRKTLQLLLTVALMPMFLLGCASTAFKLDVERELLKSYKLQTTYYAKIGDEMIELQYGKAYKMFKAKESYLSDETKYPSVLKDEPWVAWFGKNSDCILLKGEANWHAHKASGWYYDWGLRLENCNKLKENPWVAVYINTRSVYVASFAKCKTKQKKWSKDKLNLFQLMKEKYYGLDDIFISELIYNGREKNTVFLLYREYTGERMARTPFYQQLRYNIEQSSIINFKSLRIEVLNATNEGITFKVVSDEDVPWMRIDR